MERGVYISTGKHTGFKYIEISPEKRENGNNAVFMWSGDGPTPNYIFSGYDLRVHENVEELLPEEVGLLVEYAHKLVEKRVLLQELQALSERHKEIGDRLKELES